MLCEEHKIYVANMSITNNCFICNNSVDNRSQVTSGNNTNAPDNIKQTQDLCIVFTNLVLKRLVVL
jgi:hypothetical protein